MMNGGALGRVFVVLGVVAIIIGLLIMVGHRLGIGRLPGDFMFRRGGLTVYFPLATSIILSLVLTLVLTVVIGLWRR